MADVIAHFETGAYRPNKTFLEDAEYARALDCFVKGAAAVQWCACRREGHASCMHRVAPRRARAAGGLARLPTPASQQARALGPSIPPPKAAPTC
jgi:hypothetical protein